MSRRSAVVDPIIKPGWPPMSGVIDTLRSTLVTGSRGRDERSIAYKPSDSCRKSLGLPIVGILLRRLFLFPHRRCSVPLPFVGKHATAVTVDAFAEPVRAIVTAAKKV